MGNFKNIFKNLRIQNGYTQDTLADALGLSRSTVSMYENGNREPDFETLEKIADLFNTDIDYLLGRTKNTTAPVPERLNKSRRETTYEDVESLIARNGKKFTVEQKLELIKLLSELK